MKKDAISKLKRRVCIGGMAIFVVLSVELWNTVGLSKMTILLLSLLTTLVGCSLGYLFMKWYIIQHMKEE